ncbi:MAG: class I SAM-dependent methyltransferase [Bacteroidia bacterium]|nr:class I SAM-dependent methyltransferase [Bacteroidia bacterium]
MFEENWKILQKEEIKLLISQNKETEPALFALNFRQKGVPVSTIATQLKYLQKSREKLPTYYNVCAIIPPLAFEQCSSEASASRKSFEGKSVIDLTCGLGVDSLHFSKNFRNVTSIEKNRELSEIVRYNFELMRVKNINIINDSAENFLRNYKGEKVDMIYIDPSRRDAEGEKVFLPQNLQPNILEILPMMLRYAEKVVIKMSPLYDIQEAVNQFPALSEIQIISVKNECKEVLLIIQSGCKNEIPVKIKIFCDVEGKQREFSFSCPQPSFSPEAFEPEQFRYIYEPDTAFYKSRTVDALFHQYYPEMEGVLSAFDGFYFSNQFVPDFCGRVYEIKNVLPFTPRTIQAFLKKEKIHAIMIHQRHFISGATEVRNRLKVKDGGEYTLICTILPQGTKSAMLVKRVLKG